MTSQNYYLKVMPTVYSNRTSTVVSNELSVNEVSRRVEMTPFGQITSLPEIFFIYDITPFMHVVTEHRIAFAHFLVRVCAVIGGVAAVGAREREGVRGRSLGLSIPRCIIGLRCFGVFVAANRGKVPTLVGKRGVGI